MNNKKYVDDCYNKDFHIGFGDHSDPRLVTIAHISYIYLPSNPLNKVEVIIRDHDDINNPCFYILTEDRSKELYKVSLFDNNTTDGLSKEDKIYLNEFIRSDYKLFDNQKTTTFSRMKTMWQMLNLFDGKMSYNDANPPYYE